MTGYCIQCKKIREMLTVKNSTLRNRRKVYAGKCEVCNTKIIKARD